MVNEETQVAPVPPRRVAPVEDRPLLGCHRRWELCTGPMRLWRVLRSLASVFTVRR